MSSHQAAARLSLLQTDPDFVKYLDTLRKAGWFGEGEIAGSQRWKAREEQAAQAWVKLRVESDSYAPSGSAPAACSQLLIFLCPRRSQRPTFSTLFQAALAQNGPSVAELGPKQPDSDASWLQIDATSLDALMTERAGTASSRTQAGGESGLDLSLPDDEMDEDEVSAKEDDGGLGKLAERVGKFVGGRGELEGAVFDECVLPRPINHMDDELTPACSLLSELMEDNGDETGDETDDAALDADMMADGVDRASSDDDDAGAPSALSAEQRVARMASLVQPLEPGQWGASTQLTPSASTFNGIDRSTAAGGNSSSAAAAAASSFGVDDAQRRRDEIDRQAKLHALGELDAAYAKVRPANKIRRPLLEKDSYDGVDSDDESSGGEEGAQDIGASGGMSGALKAAMARDGLETDEEEDVSMVVEEPEVDMGEEESEFIKFAREALGLDEQMWQKIVGERQQRGGASSFFFFTFNCSRLTL